MVGSTSRRWSGAVGLPTIGFVLVWWAAEQWEEMRRITGSTFESPPTWRVLGWSLTLIAAGVVFGLAAGFARADVSNANMGATVVVGILPLAVVVYFVGWISLGWSPTLLRNEFGLFLVSQVTAVASCLVIGFLGAGLVAHRVTGLDKVRLVEVND